MSDLISMLQVTLREADYRSAVEDSPSGKCVRFEDDSLLGFAFVHDDAEAILRTWRDTESAVLREHAEEFRRAGEKAWNIYCVFVTASDAVKSTAARIRWIEENLERTRKIAATGLSTREDVYRALQPLLPIQQSPLLETRDVTERLRKRITSIAPDAAGAVLNPTITPVEVVRLLQGREQ